MMQNKDLIKQKSKSRSQCAGRQWRDRANLILRGHRYRPRKPFRLLKFQIYHVRKIGKETGTAFQWCFVLRGGLLLLFLQGFVLLVLFMASLAFQRATTAPSRFSRFSPIILTFLFVTSNSVIIITDSASLNKIRICSRA